MEGRLGQEGGTALEEEGTAPGVVDKHLEEVDTLLGVVDRHLSHHKEEDRPPYFAK